MKMYKKGFTVVEIMIVVAIIGLLAAICIPYILGAYSTAKSNAMNRNLAEINKTKVRLTLPLGTANGEGYTDATAIDDTVKGKINALLHIESANDLAVGGITPNYGATIGDPARYINSPD
jgi:prepilin-type N-terminal cleavage/methylation domain-containing protein